MIRTTLRALLFVTVAALAAAGAIGAVAACSNTPDAAGTCPVLSTKCPANVPSWQNDIQPLIATYCLRCHSEGGIAPPQFDYTSYQGVFDNRSVMSNDIYQCKMPLRDASPPTAMPSDQERQTFISWFACGAPQN
jgi:hypothetical protein